MLTIVIGDTEVYDEETETFSYVGGTTLELEHSLVSLSKWESKYQKPFLSSKDKTKDEIFDYLKFMIVTPNVDPELMNECTSEDLITIQEYIDSPQSATTFGHLPEKRGPSEIITSELIYYWMVAFTIPFECQYWHLNRLFSLIRICNLKNGKQKKMSRSEIAARNRELNEKRRRELGTSG